MTKHQAKDVIAFLEEILPLCDEVPAPIVEDEALARGFSMSQVKYARKIMDIAIIKDNEPRGHWIWVRCSELIRERQPSKPSKSRPSRAKIVEYRARKYGEK